IAYAGILSSAVGYTLQIVAQRDADPAVASLIMSLESVFAALSGWIFLHEKLSFREFSGCALVFGAVILCVMFCGSDKKKEKSRGK
ncbi:MAG: EamA family transporter, partial [Lachnospiraceae bacterium]|nr:EamA family transporter [Lachnospiraceae bacterium]